MNPGLVLGMLTGLASAHAVLVAATPAQRAEVAVSPGTVVLVFSESVNPVEGRIRVIGPDAARVDRAVSAQGKQVHIALRPMGRAEHTWSATG